MLSRIRKFMKSKAGFTLTELVTTMTVVGIMATVAVVKYGEWTSAGRDSAMKQTYDQIRQMAQQYYSRQSYFPSKSTLAGMLASASVSNYLEIQTGIAFSTNALGTNTIMHGDTNAGRQVSFTYAPFTDLKVNPVWTYNNPENY